ncbi:hypothetical protein L2E82_01255 [Cichorium intybus]|uniref:Uncharacterized protein n=1 Tax=Cichorium intybus TaxID=13427 RepID=A0ACB9H0J4_CICIN|nr:hypothetical protein L2E82_01255 [Cichorium intybus]
MANRSVLSLKNDNGAEDTPTLIDRKDNVFIISNFKSKYPVLQLDLRLISDLVVVIGSATCGGIAFACAGQPAAYLVTLRVFYKEQLYLLASVAFWLLVAWLQTLLMTLNNQRSQRDPFWSSIRACSSLT